MFPSLCWGLMKTYNSSAIRGHRYVTLTCAIMLPSRIRCICTHGPNSYKKTYTFLNSTAISTTQGGGVFGYHGRLLN